MIGTSVMKELKTKALIYLLIYRKIPVIIPRLVLIQTQFFFFFGGVGGFFSREFVTRAITLFGYFSVTE